MATTTGSAADPRTTSLSDQRIALRGVSWATYQRLADEVGDAAPRMAYNRGVLELMSPGVVHEKFKKRIDRLIAVVTEELDIPCASLSATRWSCPEAERALEADECYMLTAAKVEASAHGSLDSADYPPPDLAVEIDMRRGEVDRAEIYATLGVPEVWRFDGNALVIDRLEAGGRYEPAGASLFLPVSPDEVVRWVADPDAGNETAWSRRLRAWVRDEVVPRRRGGGV